MTSSNAPSDDESPGKPEQDGFDVEEFQQTAKATADAMVWVSRITSVGIAMALPAGLGYAVDRWLGSQPWGVLVGALLGLAVGGVQFAELMRDLAAKEAAKPRSKP